MVLFVELPPIHISINFQKLHLRMKMLLMMMLRTHVPCEIPHASGGSEIRYAD